MCVCVCTSCFICVLFELLGTNPWSLEAILYRFKKYQYLFYKHVLLHGLNITIALVVLNQTATHPQTQDEDGYIHGAYGTHGDGDTRGDEASLRVARVLTTTVLTSEGYFSLYWLALNTAYVMEFFLQVVYIYIYVYIYRERNVIYISILSYCCCLDYSHNYKYT